MRLANKLKASFEDAGLKPQVSYVSINGHWEDVCASQPGAKSKPPQWPKQRVTYNGLKLVKGPVSIRG